MGFSARKTGYAMSLVAGALWLALAQGAAAAPVSPVLASHRAVYDLKLLSSRTDKAPSTARGRIAFDFSGNACDGYTQSFRQMTELQPVEGPTRVSEMRSATFEDGAARNFRFKVESKVDNSGVEDIDGRASKSDDGALSVRLTRPTPSRLDLDKDILFPTEHVVRIIEAAREGKKLISAKTFDGTDSGKKVYETLTVIGREATDAVPEKAAQTPELKGVRRWPVTISYFDEDKKDNTPNYVLSFDLYENGVSRALKLDYGDFVLAGEMTQLQFLPSKGCKK